MTIINFSHHREPQHYRNVSVLENPFLYTDLLKIIYNTNFSFNSLELRKIDSRPAYLQDFVSLKLSK